MLVDAITEHEPGRRLVAVKNVTVNEEFFQGHFPGAPLMPARADARVAVAGGGHAAAAARGGAAQRARVSARRQRREVPPAGRAGRPAAARDHARPRGARRWRARRRRRTSAIRSSPKPSCCSASCPTRTADRSDGASSIPTAHDRRGHDDRPARRDRRRTCASARNCRSARRRSSTAGPTIGDGTEIFPFASIGLIPQDLKFTGEPTRLSIGQRNIFREFVTIHRGTRGGGGVTTIGDRNVFMAYVHVAHDCHVGQRHDFRQHGDARRPRRRSRTSPTSAPARACTSSAASAGTRSSAATRS